MARGLGIAPPVHHHQHKPRRRHIHFTRTSHREWVKPQVTAAVCLAGKGDLIDTNSPQRGWPAGLRMRP